MSVQITEQPTPATVAQRRLPIGAEALPTGGVSFRVWAPRRENVAVVFEDRSIAELRLTSEGNGYFAGLSADAGAGSRYRFRLDGEEYLYPDPASRFQPDGPHGPSQVVDATAFQWTDDGWPGVVVAGQVLYEMHVGTFTKEGTWAAAALELPQLKELGVTCLEVMPVADFAGTFGWGYDGVNLFAPTRLYGSPCEFRRFVDRAHGLGIGVILDLVYNHLGPDGNYLTQFSQDYFNAEHKTDWGDALNFDGQNSAPVREFYLTNARYWIEEFHLDGFRFDATQAIVDSSPRHILAEITEMSRRAGGKRSIYLINENEPQNTQLVRPIDAGGFGMDALWNDDFHHSALVALSGHNEAYYSDYFGKPQEFIAAAKWGYLYQGQRYKWQRKRRGTPAIDLPPTAFVHFLQNHDQVANSGRGLRAHEITSFGELKAMTALLLLMPQTPMLFQGQEFAASSPFYYFADHNPELAKLVCAGRAKELAQFPSVATPQMQASLLDPADRSTFERSKIDHADRARGQHALVWQLHKDLLQLRREQPVFRRVQRREDIDGAVLGDGAFVLRFFGDGDRLLVVNFSVDLELNPCPEPLMAAPAGQRWSILWSSEDPKYGGCGTAALDTEDEGWLLPGRAAVVLEPMPAEQAIVQTRTRANGSSQAAVRKNQQS
jgi:maltooligosyltrehalose trehalohydrolase